MVMRSDFIEEDVELDADWTPKRDAGGFQAMRGQQGQPGFTFRLSKEIADFLRVMLRLAVSMGILVIASKSLRPHGGIVDLLLWLGVLFAYGRHWMRNLPGGSS